MTVAEAKAFLAVVSTKSISKAAESLFLSQSTVSFQLKTLEEGLGVLLVERQKGYRQIELTPMGMKFISIAERFVQLSNEAHELKHHKTAHLSISSVDSLNVFTFSKLYKQLMQNNPLLRLTIGTYQTPEIFEQVENRIADIGFVLSPRRFQNVVMTPVLRERFLVVQLRKKEDPVMLPPIHAKHLDFEKEILLSWGPEFALWQHTWREHNISPYIHVDTISMLLQHLTEGYWTILPISLVNTLQASYPLSYRTILDGPPDRVCYKIINKFPKISQQPAINYFNQQFDIYLKEASIFTEDTNLTLF